MYTFSVVYINILLSNSCIINNQIKVDALYGNTVSTKGQNVTNPVIDTVMSYNEGLPLRQKESLTF